MHGIALATLCNTGEEIGSTEVSDDHLKRMGIPLLTLPITIGQ